MLHTSNLCIMHYVGMRKKMHKILGPIPRMTFDSKVISVAQNLRSIKNTIDNHCGKYELPQSNCKIFSLNIFYLNLVDTNTNIYKLQNVKGLERTLEAFVILPLV